MPPCFGRQSPAGQSNDSRPVKSKARPPSEPAQQHIGESQSFGPRKPGGDERVRAIDEVVRGDRPARVKDGHDRDALAANALERCKILRIAARVTHRRREGDVALHLGIGVLGGDHDDRAITLRINAAAVRRL